jgi:hypothetical protein
MARRQSAKADPVMKSQDLPGAIRQPRRHDEHAVIRERDQGGVEGRVDLGREQEAVEDVEALGVGRAIGPGLD